MKENIVKEIVNNAFEVCQEIIKNLDSTYSGKCGKIPMMYCAEFDPFSKNCQECDLRPRGVE
jgi:hypothetical protein